MRFEVLVVRSAGILFKRFASGDARKKAGRIGGTSLPLKSRLSYKEKGTVGSRLTTNPGSESDYRSRTCVNLATFHRTPWRHSPLSTFIFITSLLFTSHYKTLKPIYKKS